jgi:hypothetical protein
MTSNEILNMPAGHEMDALVENVIFERTLTNSGNNASYIKFPNGYADLRLNKKYSTDIGAAFEMAEHLRKELGTCKFYFIVDPKQGNNIRAIFIPLLEDDCFEASADTAALAICRAALLAKVAK